MVRLARALCVTALVLGVSGAQAAELRFSGQVTLVDPGGATILVEELGSSKGSRPLVIQRAVNVGPDTRVAVVVRERQPDGLPGAYRESPATPRDVKSGDFVTVTAHQRGRELHAASVSIIRTDATR